MNKQFVTHDIAIALKELGYNDRIELSGVSPYYRDETLMFCNESYFDVHPESTFIYAPLWQQVIDWFREKHQIYISPRSLSGNDPKYQIHQLFGKNKSFEIYLIYGENYYEARKAAILEAIKLVKGDK